MRRDSHATRGLGQAAKRGTPGIMCGVYLRSTWGSHGARRQRPARGRGRQRGAAGGLGAPAVPRCGNRGRRPAGRCKSRAHWWWRCMKLWGESSSPRWAWIGGHAAKDAVRASERLVLPDSPAPIALLLPSTSCCTMLINLLSPGVLRADSGACRPPGAHAQQSDRRDRFQQTAGYVLLFLSVCSSHLALCGCALGVANEESTRSSKRHYFSALR